MLTLDETLVPHFPVGSTIDQGGQGNEYLIYGGHELYGSTMHFDDYMPCPPCTPVPWVLPQLDHCNQQLQARQGRRKQDVWFRYRLGATICTCQPAAGCNRPERARWSPAEPTSPQCCWQLKCFGMQPVSNGPLRLLNCPLHASPKPSHRQTPCP